MAKEDRVRLPSGTGGLVSYFDEYKSKIKASPSVVIAIILTVMIIIILLHVFGGRWIGA